MVAKPRVSHPVGIIARVTDDDARARALEENRRRSEVMAEAQRYGPPAPRSSPRLVRESPQKRRETGSSSESEEVPESPVP